MALMTFESILKSLPSDPDKALESLMKSYMDVRHWITYHSSSTKGANAKYLPHLQTVAGQLARELAARLLDAYPAPEGVTVDDIETWTALERIADS